MKKIVLFLITSVLFTVVLLSVKNSYSAYTKNVQTSLEVTTPKLEAVFLPGAEFNVKIKKLAGNNSANSESIDTNITSIVRSNVLTITPTENNVVSASDSSFPIYAWYDSGVLYYYTEVEHPYLNEQASIMFYKLSNVTSIDISTLDTSKTTKMRSMFNSDSNLISLNLSNFDTSKVQTMQGMFYGMSKLTNIIGINNFDTSSLTDVIRMFANCTSLEVLNLESIDLSKVTDTTGMLNNLNNLKELKTPKVYPNDTSVILTLPKTMYDSNLVGYTTLGKSTNPVSPTETIIKEGYIVTFDANGGSVNPSTKIVRYGDNYDLPTPTREGYIFKGWNGKNMLNPDEEYGITYNGYIDSNSYTYNNVSKVYTANYDDNSNIYGYDITKYITVGNTYTYSVNVINPSSSSHASIGFDCMLNSSRAVFYNSVETIVGNRIYYTLTIPTGVTRCVVGVNNSSFSGSGLQFNNLQLEEGNVATPYESYYVTNNTKVTKLENHTLTAEWEDNQAPTLSLSKITYKEGFDGWTFNNAYVDSEGILHLGDDGNTASATTTLYDVNKLQHYMTFEIYTTNASTNFNPNGGIYVGTQYYDENRNVTPDTTSGYNYTGNGWALPATLNTWTSMKHYHSDIYGFKYIQYFFQSDEAYGKSPILVRNIKVWGQLPNSFYLINVESNDNEGVVETKYAKGNQNKTYFENNGTVVTNNQIVVNENGIYTVFVKDAIGNSTIQTIEITNIANVPWEYAYNGTDGTDGSAQIFTAPFSGTYKLETWGAQGGNNYDTKNHVDEPLDPVYGGYGGYSTGEMHISKNEKIYIIVGAQGVTAYNYPNVEPNIEVYAYPNGGAVRSNNENYKISYNGGGGSTHIARQNKLISELDPSSTNLLMVAAGGGGVSNWWKIYSDGGSGGGYIGGSTTSNYNGNNPTGGTQNSGGLGGGNSTSTYNGVYGIGGGSNFVGNNNVSGGGGGGFYGGGASWGGSGAGGSSYIGNTSLTNKSMYCYNCQESLSNSTQEQKNTFTVSTTGSSAYKDTTNCPDGYSSSAISKCAKAGNGYARITLVSLD